MITIAQTNDTSVSIEIPGPMFGYGVSIELPRYVSDVCGGGISVRCEGEEYAIYRCRATWRLDDSDADALQSLIVDGNRIRSYTYTITPDADSGFFPAGPQRGSVGPFSVRFDRIGYTDRMFSPGKMHDVELSMIVVGTLPTYSTSTGLSEGPITLGSVTGLRQPPGGFSPSLGSVSGVLPAWSRGAWSTDRVDGNSPTTHDKHEAKATWILNQGAAESLVEVLLANTDSAINFTCSGTGVYPFGRAYGNVTSLPVYYTEDTIALTHEAHNRWAMPLTLVPQ